MNTKNYNELVHIKPKIVKEEFLQRKVDTKESFFNRAKEVKKAFFQRHLAKKQEFISDKPQRVLNDFLSKPILVKNEFWLRNNQKIKDIKFKIFVKPKEDYYFNLYSKIMRVKFDILGI